MNVGRSVARKALLRNFPGLPATLGTAWLDSLRAAARETGLVEFRAHTTKGDLAMEARMVHEGGQWRWCGSRPQPKSTGITIHFP